MNHFKISLAYKGTNYFGWQVQPNQRTIQGEINHALEKILKNKNFKTLGAGRTDAGVHAKAQVCKISIDLTIEERGLLKGLNSFLPQDIRVLSCEKINEAFMPTVDAISKRYEYLFTNNEYSHPLTADLISNISYELDVQLMKEACKLFIGEFDFANFQTTGTEVKSTVRRVFVCELYQENSQEFGEFFRFSVEGDGFLKQMVRLMMGAVWEIGRGKSTLDDLREALSMQKTIRVGPVAPPQGLYMCEVRYK